MKKIFLTGLLCLLMISTNARQMIDLEAFMSFVNAVEKAEEQKDQQKLQQLRAQHEDYLWKNLKKKADKGDAEAAAYVACIMNNLLESKTFGYKFGDGLTFKDGRRMEKYFATAIDNAYNQGLNSSQVLFYRASFRYNNLNNYDDLFDVTQNELLTMIGRDMKDATYGGYKPAEYMYARIMAVKEPWRFHEYIYNKWAAHEYFDYKDYKDEYMPRGEGYFKEALKYYTRAATHGAPEFQIELAQYLLENVVQIKSCRNIQETYSDRHQYVYHDSSDEWDPSDVEAYKHQAAYWYKQAALQGDTIGMVNYAFCIMSEIEDWDVFADENNHLNREALGDTVVAWLEKAAEKGSILAMRDLCAVYLPKGAYCLTYINKDPQKLFKYAQMGAERGNRECAELLGYCYHFGYGTPVNMTEAYRWYKVAADLGMFWSSWQTGNYYEDKKLGNNMELAVHYWEESRYIKEAYGKLAKCYGKGIGVVMDRAKARRYQEWHDDSDQKEYLVYPILLYHLDLSEGMRYISRFIHGTPLPYEAEPWR